MNTVTRMIVLSAAAFFAVACSPEEGRGDASVAATPAERSDADSASGTDAGTVQLGSASGTITAIDPAGTITIDHGPLPALEWPAMTMGFAATPEQAGQVAVGQQVDFEFEMRGNKATITSIAPTE